jgi:hypothetical protein
MPSRIFCKTNSRFTPNTLEILVLVKPRVPIPCYAMFVEYERMFRPFVYFALRKENNRYTLQKPLTEENRGLIFQHETREKTKNTKIFYQNIFSYVSSFRVFRVKKRKQQIY